MKLTDMLMKFEELEESLLEIPTELALDLKDKVDAYVFAMDRIESDAERFKKLADFFRDKAKQRENELERFKEYTLSSMKAFGWDQLSGEKRKLKIINQKRFAILRDPTIDDRSNMPSMVQETHHIEYKWNKDLLKEAFEKERLPEDQICTLKEITYVKRG